MKKGKKRPKAFGRGKIVQPLVSEEIKRNRLQEAVKLHNAGQLNSAEKIYRAILADNPEQPDALNLLGVLALQERKYDTAIKLISLAIKIYPCSAQFFINLGLAHMGIQHNEEALSCFGQALKLEPKNAEAYFHIGNVNRIQNKEMEAIAYYQKAINVNPDHAEAYNNLGNAYKALGRFDEAIASFQKGLQLRPTMAEAYTNMGIAYQEMNKPQESVACYQKAIEIRPDDYADPYNNIGYILQRLGKLTEAIRFLQKGLTINHDCSGIYHNLGNVFKDMGEFEQAIAHYRKALDIDPHFVTVHSNILVAMNYNPKSDPAGMYQAAKNWWQKQCASITNQFSHQNPPTPEKRLKIGYVSPDFFVHSVSFFFVSLLKAHNHDRFEIYCYSDVKNPDTMTDRLNGLSDHWRSILGLSDEAVAEIIYKDQIDILVDLAGHTAYNRLLVFARKPAPIQVSWLGYPNTTGIPVIDYRLCDSITDPEGDADQYYSEKLLRLPNGFLCYSPFEESPEVGVLPMETAGHVIFGSFNNISKTTERVVETWSKILQKVPNAKILLKNIVFSDPGIRKRYLSLFDRYGVSKERIEMVAWTESSQEHLALYNKIDIGLDPFPYNGTTTTFEALWMGVPVIALQGNCHAARVGTSILTHLGLKELVAESEEEYIKTAVGLANNKSRLSGFRKNLRACLQESPLCDAESFARDIESLYQSMWQKWVMKQDSINMPIVADTQKEGENVVQKPGKSSINLSPEKEREREQLLAKINDFSFWYHKIQLPHGIVTPGWAPINSDTYRIPERLDGKRVLDIGAWDGYWTFEALRRGAKEVIAIDDFSDYLGALENRDRKAWETFDLCKKSIGYTDEKCKRFEMSIYDLNEETFGHFDIIFFFGTLYHLRYPLLALDILSTICDEEIFIESAILDDFSPYKGGLGNGYSGQMVMEFYPGKEYGDNNSNWWAPTLKCMVNMVDAAGFVDCKAWKLTDIPQELPQCRGFAYGRTPNAK